ncbi:MAG TPA: DNA polymerase III subunit delta [Ignavibacteriaceae bacterium]|nr:DNA polymerase III subunit delta [Ignavibacteriaceae bacterium]
MAKSKAGVQSIQDALKKLNAGEILPVYFLFGEDSFSLDTGLKAIEKAVRPHLQSDFDYEVFHGEDKIVDEVLGFAEAFPFGSGKKLIIFKELEKVKDKKKLAGYAASPPDFTVMVLIHSGEVSNLASEPYRTLVENRFLFEAKELKGKNLLDWLTGYCESIGKNISEENAQILLDITGENRTLLESQIEKISIYLGDKKEISLDSIRGLSTALKEYTIFDLQNAIGRKDKPGAMKIAFNMLDKGAEPTYILFMLTRYFTGLSRITEMTSQKLPDAAAARIVGTHPFYYKDYLKAKSLYSESNMYNSVQALLKADVSIKTTSADPKTVISILITEIIG